MRGMAWVGWLCIVVAAASAQEAEVLNIETGAPLLTIYRWTLDRRGHPVEYVRSSSPGDRFHFVIKLEQ